MGHPIFEYERVRHNDELAARQGNSKTHYVGGEIDTLPSSDRLWQRTARFNADKVGRDDITIPTDHGSIVFHIDVVPQPGNGQTK
jgi:hypothetical protein